MNILNRTLWISLAMLVSLPVTAQDLLMVRSKVSFPETMLLLQGAIVAQGYTVSRVQRVDIGLTAMGYETDKYRVVFLGKPAEIRILSGEFPQLIPYLPLQISIFAENDQTLVVSANPSFLANLYPDPELKPVFARWESDIRTILEDVRME